MGLRSGSRGWELEACAGEGGRRRRVRKVEVVELDLERLQGDRERSGVGCGQEGRRKKKSLNRDQETLY